MMYRDESRKEVVGQRSQEGTQAAETLPKTRGKTNTVNTKRGQNKYGELKIRGGVVGRNTQTTEEAGI